MLHEHMNNNIHERLQPPGVVYAMDFAWTLYILTLYMNFVYTLNEAFFLGIESAYKQHYNGDEDKYYSRCKFRYP